MKIQYISLDLIILKAAPQRSKRFHAIFCFAKWGVYRCEKWKQSLHEGTLVTYCVYIVLYCDLANCTVWVQNLVSHFEEGTQTEGF